MKSYANHGRVSLYPRRTIPLAMKICRPQISFPNRSLNPPDVKPLLGTETILHRSLFRDPRALQKPEHSCTRLPITCVWSVHSQPANRQSSLSASLPCLLPHFRSLCKPRILVSDLRVSFILSITMIPPDHQDATPPSSVHVPCSGNMFRTIHSKRNLAPEPCNL